MTRASLFPRRTTLALQASPFVFLLLVLGYLLVRPNDVRAERNAAPRPIAAAADALTAPAQISFTLIDF